jgi:Saxitoxin biosynthesis operon protein SxtJ
MIAEEIKNIKQSSKDLRKFGITVGLVFILLAFLLFRKHSGVYISIGILGAILFLIGLVFPIILKPLHKVWMTIAILIGWIMTRLILMLFFFIILTPISFLARLFGKRFLDLKIDYSKKSYWELREKKKLSKGDYERQF